MSKNKIKNLSRFVERFLSQHDKKVKFTLVGGVCFLINSVVLYVLTKNNLPVGISQIIGYEAGLLFGFLANSQWTYKKNDRGSTLSSLIKYHSASLSALVISTVIVVFLTKWFSIHPNIALVFASAVTLLWNYFMFDRFVFNKVSLSPTPNSDKKTLLKGVAIIFVTWKVLLIIFGISFSAINPTQISPISDAWHNNTSSFLQQTYRWDAQWYAGISQDHWYHTHPQAPAFYPLFPSIVHEVSHITGGDPVLAAFIINTIASGLAFYYLALIAYKKTGDRNKSLRIVALFAVFPMAFFLHAMYTEALLCALAFGAYYYALGRRWLLSCILLSLAVITRLPAVFFVMACGLEYLKSIQYNFKKIDHRIIYFLITPLGFLAYAYYLYRTYGTPLYMFKAYTVENSWAYIHFNPNIFANIYHTAYHALAAIFTHSANWFFFSLWQFPSLLIWLFTVGMGILGFIKKVIDLPMFSLLLASCLFFVVNNNFVSVGRYILPLFPLYFALEYFTRRHSFIFIGSIVALYAIQLWFFALFIMNYFIA